ncbi:MAG: hypothetical protein WC683_02770 [bacterium]
MPHTIKQIDGSEKVVGDSDFLNACNRFGTLHHMGFGEFYLERADGTRIDFARRDGYEGWDFEGRIGRPHHVYSDKGGDAAVRALVAEMETAGASKRVG